MSLTLGSRIGPFEVLAPLGAGGMGEVFRARDTRLDRVVALKVLPRAFAADAERLGRFEREAKLLASLHHPNIALLYGLEDGGGTPCLVLELVEGESLAQRLARGPIPVRETLAIAGAIAAALEAAHARGIVHRDLKPGNVMLAEGGIVKVLDFGLAKASPAASGVDLSMSPTVAVGATGAGTILGTAAYMSPEQARGRSTDARTDVWALGCVLFECLTARPAFAGDTASDVLARVLDRDPDWNRLPVSAPPRFQALVRRLLAKDAEARPREMAEVRSEVEAIAGELSAPATGSSARGVARPVPSLAVLEFENLAKDSEGGYFCAGITEDLLTDLSKIRGLKVASRNAVARYRGTRPEIATVGADLGVGAVLEGSVRRAGDRVRITAQLISTADGFQLWAERYDRTMDDVFAVQAEIAAAIAKALSVALAPGEIEDLGRNRPQDVRAYDLYLRGRAEYGHYTREGLAKAKELFEEALRVDPQYALAWAGIADCCGQFLQWGYAEDAAAMRSEGFAAVERALAIDPRLVEAWKAKSLVHQNSAEPKDAMAALRRALEIQPRFLPALVNLGVALVREADIAGAERVFRRVREIDPQEPFGFSWCVWVLWMTRREEEAVGLMPAYRALSDDPLYVSAVYAFRGWWHARQGDWAAVRECVREGIADGATRERMVPLEAVAAVGRGEIELAKDLLRECVDSRSLGAFGMILTAVVAARIGDLESVIRVVSRPLIRDLLPVIARLEVDLHVAVASGAFGTARLDRTLIWPLEAPMLLPEVHALFREVKVESGRPPASGEMSLEPLSRAEGPARA